MGERMIRSHMHATCARRNALQPPIGATDTVEWVGGDLASLWQSWRTGDEVRSRSRTLRGAPIAFAARLVAGIVRVNTGAGRGCEMRARLQSVRE